MPGRPRSTATPGRSRRCSTPRSKARSTCAAPPTSCPTWSPTSAARSTSSSTAASTRPRAAASAPPSKPSPTPRSPSSSSKCRAARRACSRTAPTSAPQRIQGDGAARRPERQDRRSDAPLRRQGLQARAARRPASAQSTSIAPGAEAGRDEAQSSTPHRRWPLAAFALGAPAAQAAAAPPQILATWVTTVSATSANLRAEINPAGTPDHLPLRIHDRSGLPRKRLRQRARESRPAPKRRSASGNSPVAVVQHLGGLEPDTALPLPRRRHQQRRHESRARPARCPPTNRHRSSRCPTTAAGRWSRRSTKTAARSRASAATSAAACSRPPPRAAPITYTSSSSFGDPPGRAGRQPVRLAAGANRRWTTENITTPMLSGSYPGIADERRPLPALLRRPRRRACSATAAAAAARRPKPVPGRKPAAAGLRSAGRLPQLLPARSTPTAASRRCSPSADIADLQLGPEDFELAFAGATPDLAHVVLSTCAALTPDATEVPGTEGECDASQTEPLREVRLRRCG